MFLPINHPKVISFYCTVKCHFSLSFSGVFVVVGLFWFSTLLSVGALFPVAFSKSSFLLPEL